MGQYELNPSLWYVPENKVQSEGWYHHTQTKHLKMIDPSIPSREQFELIRSYDWTEEQPQVDLFCSLMKNITHENPTILELGSCGCGNFYSVLFEKWFDNNCTIINVDPRLDVLEEVHTYWKDQHLQKARLHHGYVGVPKHYQARPDFVTENTPHLQIKDLMSENKIDHLDILHADIQGSEISLLEELEKDDLFKNIRYFFISTHAGDGISTYDSCVNLLSKNMNSKFYYSDPYSGGWGDGLIVVENLDWGI